MNPINLAQKLSLFAEHWSPKVIAELNDYQFKLVKFQMQIGFRDQEVTVKEGEVFVVKKGVEHITRAKEECHAMIIEPRGVVNTGEAGGELTASNDVWI